MKYRENVVWSDKTKILEEFGREMALHITSQHLEAVITKKDSPLNIKYISVSVFNTFFLCHSTLLHITLFMDFNILISLCGFL